MRLFSFFVVGLFFGVVMTKSEAISWFRIHEMFRFESIHMYGIIGVAVILGVAILTLLKRSKFKTLNGSLIDYTPMKFNAPRHIIAGTIFGLGWALMGSCPGPMFILLGNGYWILLVTLAGATLGTFTYGVIKHKLIH